MGEMPPPKRKACIECTKAKRKCDKLSPRCKRCREKQLVCRYPIRPPVVIYDEIPGEEDESLSSTPAKPLATLPSYSSSLLSSPKNAATSAKSSDWLLSPEFWKIEHTPRQDQSGTFNEAGLHSFIRTMRGWLEQWVMKGNCPIIHSHIYRNSLPATIQDAYTSVTAYMARNSANKTMTLRIIESRCNALIQAQSDSDFLGEDLGAVVLDTRSHLVRTQVLVIYQLIRLFDGDIRARVQAEDHIETLNVWAAQMWESACLDVKSAMAGDGEQDRLSDETWLTDRTNIFRVENSPSSNWQAWIMAESLRRTYFAALYMQSVFITLKNGIAFCPGGSVFTVGKGMWDATSPYAWLESRRTSKIPFLAIAHIHKLFDEARPSDVDEFAHTALIMCQGLERMQEWRGEYGEKLLDESQTQTYGFG